MLLIWSGYCYNNDKNEYVLRVNEGYKNEYVLRVNEGYKNEQLKVVNEGYKNEYGCDMICRIVYVADM